MHEECLKASNILLHIDPNAFDALGSRALAKHKLGLAEDALKDLQRYFSFIDKEAASFEIQATFIQLDSLKKLNAAIEPELLH